MNVSVSISDLPVLRNLDYLFTGLKAAGADGLEIVTGVKSRWSWKRIKYLTEKHDLPITSIHQPPWSALNIYFDERFVKNAVAMGVTNFVYHPLARYSFQDRKMIAYADRLAALRKQYNVNIMLENMPLGYRRRFASQLYRLHTDTLHVENFPAFLKKYHLNFNFDTSHAFVSEPQKEPWFDDIYPLMRNIHLSSFRPGRDHLPLDLGDFNTRSFIKELKRRKYTGLITLEIFYPRMIRVSRYDFDAIKRSIDLIKSI